MKRSWLGAYLFIAAVLFAIGGVIFTAITAPGIITVPADKPLHKVSSGWYHELPDQVQTIVPGSTIPTNEHAYAINKHMSAKSGGRVLMFYNNRQAVTVTVDDKVIYALGSDISHVKMNAALYCIMDLPESGEPFDLRITFDHISGGEVEIPEIYIGSPDSARMDLLFKDVFSLLGFPLLAVIAVGLLVIVIFLRAKGIREQRVGALALFLLIFAVWSFTDMYSVALLPINPEINSIASYYALMLMPIPIVVFARYSCQSYTPKTYTAALIVVTANVIIQSALYLLGFIRLFQLLFVSQGLMIGSSVYGLLLMILEYRTKKSTVNALQIVGYAAPVLFGTLTVVFYWLDMTLVYRATFQSVVYIFLALSLLVLLFAAYTQSNTIDKQKAEIVAYKRLAVTDPLTGLPNRAAFDQKLEKVWADPSTYPNAYLIFFDLNGLKYVNDTYGHMAGDELIVSAGQRIRRSFEGAGECYRVGGDEFAVVATNLNMSLDGCYEALNAQIDMHNKGCDIPFSVAKGQSSLIDSIGHRRSLSDWKTDADKNMYTDKLDSHYLYVRGSDEDYQEIMTSFASAVDAKDSYTADHSGRVAVLCDRVCDMLGVSETSKAQVHMAANLHDIGKIGIPDSILLKEGSLNDVEWITMRSHTTIGEDIMKHTKAFYEVSQIIRHHHERFDGKGYPDGLKGLDIPLGARIIAIADSIDAMTSNRSYRTARTLDFCHEQIESNLGTMYDPAIGAIVLEHWDVVEDVILMNPKDFAEHDAEHFNALHAVHMPH